MADDTRVGTELGEYRIERLIGRGGMSSVNLAHHERLGRRVALELLAPELADSERFRDRFLRESRLAASLDHPNNVTIYDADEGTAPCSSRSGTSRAPISRPDPVRGVPSVPDITAEQTRWCPRGS